MERPECREVNWVISCHPVFLSVSVYLSVALFASIHLSECLSLAFHLLVSLFLFLSLFFFLLVLSSLSQQTPTLLPHPPGPNMLCK